MRVALHRRVVDVGGRERAAHACGAALEHLLDQLLDVHGVIHRAPHPHVLHGPGLEVHEREVVDARGHRGAEPRAPAPLDRLDGVGRHVLHDVDLAREQGGEAGAELGDEAEGHAARVRRPLPVVGVLLEDEPLVALPLDELEGPGADGPLGELRRAELAERLGG